MRFVLKRLALLRLCAMTLILPVLVAVFGILSVYGRQGWLASLCQSLSRKSDSESVVMVTHGDFMLALMLTIEEFLHRADSDDWKITNCTCLLCGAYRQRRYDPCG